MTDFTLFFACDMRHVNCFVYIVGEFGKTSGSGLLIKQWLMSFFVCVQLYSTTLFGVPFPLPTPQVAGIGNSGTSPRPRFEGSARQPSGQRALQIKQWLLSKYFRVHAAFIDHTVQNTLSPPHNSRRWDRQLRDKPETNIRGRQ
jgi:hypothetical protein